MSYSETDYKYLAQCAGKAAFDTYQLATKVQDRRKHRGRRGNAYRCPHCRKYHIGEAYRPPRGRGKWH